jgi:hypothetical protein
VRKFKKVTKLPDSAVHKYYLRHSRGFQDVRHTSARDLVIEKRVITNIESLNIARNRRVEKGYLKIP